MARTRRRGLVTRWELAVGLCILAAAAAYVLPIAQRATWRTRRAEAPFVLEAILAAQARHTASTGSAFAVPSTPVAPDAVGRHRTPWTAGPPPFPPPSTYARCAYRTTSLAPLVVQATCDVDGDGVQAVFEGRPGYDIVQLTPEDVY